jgi:hypothetical protein
MRFTEDRLHSAAGGLNSGLFDVGDANQHIVASNEDVDLRKPFLL